MHKSGHYRPGKPGKEHLFPENAPDKKIKSQAPLAPSQLWESTGVVELFHAALLQMPGTAQVSSFGVSGGNHARMASVDSEDGSSRMLPVLTIAAGRGRGSRLTSTAGAFLLGLTSILWRASRKAQMPRKKLFPTPTYSQWAVCVNLNFLMK